MFLVRCTHFHFRWSTGEFPSVGALWYVVSSFAGFRLRPDSGFYRLEWIFDNMSLFDYLKTSFLDQHVEQEPCGRAWQKWVFLFLRVPRFCGFKQHQKETRHQQEAHHFWGPLRKTHPTVALAQRQVVRSHLRRTWLGLLAAPSVFSLCKGGGYCLGSLPLASVHNSGSGAGFPEKEDVIRWRSIS